MATKIKTNLSDSEKKILRQIKNTLGKNHRRYDFWFVYNTISEAVSWEGGFELGQSPHFRNQYSIIDTAGDGYNYGKLVQNWE